MIQKLPQIGFVIHLLHLPASCYHAMVMSLWYLKSQESHAQKLLVQAPDREFWRGAG